MFAHSVAETMFRSDILESSSLGQTHTEKLFTALPNS